MTYQLSLDILPNLLGTILVGVFAKRYGRKYVLTCNLLFYLLAQVWKLIVLRVGMPIKFVWISSSFLFFAAGPEMRTEILFMIITEATPQKHLCRIYKLVQICNIFASFISTIAAAELMKHDTWIPISFGLSTIVLAILLVLIFISEPGNKSFTPASSAASASSSGNMSSGTTIQDRLLPVSHQITDFFRIIWSSHIIRFLLLTFLLTSTFPQLIDGGIFLQYISTKLHRNFAEASQLQASSSVMNVAVFIISLPFTNETPAVLYSRSWKSALLQVLGFVLIGFSSSSWSIIISLGVCACGQLLRVSLRALLISLVNRDKDNVTELFTAITTLDIIGGPAINYILAYSFARGLELGGYYIGFPFFIAALLLGVVAILVLCNGSYFNAT